LKFATLKFTNQLQAQARGLLQENGKGEKLMNFKKVRLSAFATMLLCTSAYAIPPWTPHPPRPPRIITVTGQGSGGSHLGDRRGACYRAEERARQDAYQDCSRYRGQLLNVWASPCSCTQRGREVNCRSTAHGSCRIYSWGGHWSEDLNAPVEDILMDSDSNSTTPDSSNGNEGMTEEWAD